MNIKVSIVEDHKEFRESIAYILSSSEGFECTGKFSSVEDALINMNSSNVILLDINLPGMSGIEGVSHLKQKFPEAYIIMLTVFEDNDHVFNAILAGADGYILKKSAPIRVLQAIEDAALGGAPMSPSIAKQTVNYFKTFIPKKDKETVLTQREKEILHLLVQGIGNDEISQKLFISIQTVRNHVRHIYGKLHVHSKAQAIVKAIKENIV